MALALRAGALAFQALEDRLRATAYATVGVVAAHHHAAAAVSPNSARRGHSHVDQGCSDLIPRRKPDTVYPFFTSSQDTWGPFPAFSQLDRESWVIESESWASVQRQAEGTDHHLQGRMTGPQ